MKKIHRVELKEGSQEELLPGFSREFPYIASHVELDHFRRPYVPWHWHRTVELFYVESGILEYSTPKGTWEFPAGTGGFVNANILLIVFRLLCILILCGYPKIHKMEPLSESPKADCGVLQFAGRYRWYCVSLMGILFLGMFHVREVLESPLSNILLAISDTSSKITCNQHLFR